jgi:hypothetical protein
MSERAPVISMVNPRQPEISDDLPVVDSPPLRRRPIDPDFSAQRLLIDRPSFGRRASRALLRFLAAFCLGIAVTLAWQSYGDVAKQTIATWAAQRGWSTAWLSDAKAAKSNLPPAREIAAPAAPAVSGAAPSPAAAASSPDLQQLKATTLELAANLATMRERLEQLAATQEQTASAIGRLQAAEQEMRQKIAAAAPRPAAAPASKSITPAAPPRVLAPQPR